MWSEWRDSNSRHPAPKAGALPAALHPDIDFDKNTKLMSLYKIAWGSSRQSNSLSVDEIMKKSFECDSIAFLWE